MSTNRGKFVGAGFRMPYVKALEASTVDFLDINPFIARLTSATVQAEADMNQDGVVNFLDIAPFITALSSQ